MASAWIEKAPTAAGKTRWRVRFRLGGSESPALYAGKFRYKSDALERCKWVSGELAAMRVPNLATLREQERAPLFEQAAAAWQASRLDIAENTRIQHRTALRKALPTLGKRHVDEITAPMIAALVVALHEEGAARESIRKVVNAIAMVLDHARLDHPNPARDKVTIRLPRAEQEEINPPTADHVEAVFRLLPRVHRLPLLFLDWSGARVAAIDKTLVGDWDELNRRVRLKRSTTKTRRPLWIDCPDPLADAIEALLPPREDRDIEARLFSGSSSDALRTAIAKACRAAAIPPFSPHDLRHRRISLLHYQGRSWAEIGRLVGQRKLSTTADIYTHVLFDAAEVDYTELLDSRKAA